MATRGGDNDTPLHVADAKKDARTHPAAPAVVSSRPGRTLLPRPLAQAVSFATRSTCFAIRAGSTVSSYGFDVAKVASLSSLELSRAVIESLLSRTGRHVLRRSKTDLSREEAESILESSLASVHQTISKALFWTTAGFELTGSTISLASDFSQLVLSSLDQFFGSTDSSRAIASIIILIRREFQNPATGAEGEKVGVIDLIVGLSALSLLQHHCRKVIEAEDRQMGSEEVVWDVVVLNDGDRVDVQTDGQVNLVSSETGMNPPSHIDPAVMRSIEEHGTLEDSDDEDLPEMRLKDQIMQSLPVDTTVSISTSVTTTKTITVDVNGPEIPLLSPPPGVEIVEEQRLSTPGEARTSPGRPQSPTRPGYRVVYRVDRNKLQNTELRRCDDPDLGSSGPRKMGEAEEITDSPRSSRLSAGSSKAPVPARTRGGSPHPGRRGQLNMTSRPQSPNQRRDGPTLQQSQAKPLPDPTKTNKSRPSTTANQKRTRMPARSESQDEKVAVGRGHAATQRNLPSKKPKSDFKSSDAIQRPSEKRPGLKQAFKLGPSHAFSSLWAKDPTSSGRAPTNKSKLSAPATIVSHARGPSNSHRRDPPPSRGKESRLSIDVEYPPALRRTPSHSSYISVHERCRDSIVSTTDTFSIHSAEESYPPSPVALRSEARSRRNSGSTPQDGDGYDAELLTPRSSHGRKPTTPSLYSIASNDSQTSLVLSSYYQRGAYSDSDALRNLRRTGMVEGTFPRFHILRNITRYVRFSTASYGSSFMKYMGISKEMPILKALDNTHHDIRSFIKHTKSTQESILLASFVDPQGGSNSAGKTNTGVPLVHYISLDHESKAVVLACRGTLGFEDVLADMTCDYDDLVWRGKSYKVHKGIHASARRLLYGADGKVLQMLKVALEEFEDYGLVLCGHSLGGGVTALLGVMLSEPNTPGTNFVTSSEPHTQFLSQEGSETHAHVCLPPNRPIHVYAYGPPGTMSASLRKAARGLVTTVVQGNDLVPYLSLGVLHDMQAVALAFKTDSGAAKAEIRNRVWERFQGGLADRWYNRGTTFVKSRDNEWAVTLLRSLRSTMVYEKLLPPGEVFVVESTRVLRRDAFVERSEDHIGRPARRAVLKYVKDVEARFGEARFGTSMLMDHSPASYEDALNTLRMGVSGADFGR